VHDREFAVRLRRGGEGRDEVPVEFDDRERAVPIEQREGDGALAGADFDEAIAGPRVHGLHDLRDDALLVQEVLAEVLLRAGLERGGLVAHAAISLRAMRAQMDTAANRLEGSAMPLPASSSAVPWSTATRG